MKKPNQPGVVPAGGYWRIEFKPLGLKIAHPYYSQVKAKFHGELVKANYPIPFNFDEWFESLVCEGTPQGCYEVPETPPENEDLTLGKMAKQFTGSMVEWAKAGFPVTDWAEFKRRRDICTGTPTTPRCPHFSPGSTFMFARCGKCGCTKLKLGMLTAKCPIGKW